MIKMHSVQEVKTHVLNQVKKDFDLIHNFEFSIHGWNYKATPCKMLNITANAYTFEFTYQCEYIEYTTFLIKGILKHNKDDTLTTIAIHEVSTY